MRYAIITDIHANLAAFTAVLDDIKRRGGADELWCLGDVVGYGPEPHHCIELLCQYRHVCVAGNHDFATVGRIDTADFNPDAVIACQWTAQQLYPEDIRYLKERPLLIQRAGFTLVHGSPRGPIWEYLLSSQSAAENLACFETQVCLVGHTHVPLVFEFAASGACSRREFREGSILLTEEARLIINPGGIGQPRDGDPRAGYALYDDEAGTITACRVPYDIGLTQQKMIAYRLPHRLISRLSHGW